MISAILTRGLPAACASLMVGCGPFLGDMAEDRRRYAEAGEGPIVVAAVVDDHGGPGSHFVNGIRLALHDVNASEEGLLGRRMELALWPGSDDDSTVTL